MNANVNKENLQLIAKKNTKLYVCFILGEKYTAKCR